MEYDLRSLAVWTYGKESKIVIVPTQFGHYLFFNIVNIGERR